MNDYYLIHYGVKGMKWGVIRKRVSDSVHNSYHYQKHQLKKRAKIEKARRKYSAKTVRGLSDDELNARIERLRLEKKYKELTEKDIAPGRQVTKEILASSGKKVATAVATAAIAYSVKSAINKKTNNKDRAEYIMDAIDRSIGANNKNDKKDKKDKKDKDD